MNLPIALQDILINIVPAVTQAADAAAPAAAETVRNPVFERAMVYAAAFMTMGLAAAGAAFGCGVACIAAINGWRDCCRKNKIMPFQLLIFAGSPLAQAIYGMIVMFIIMTADLQKPFSWYVYIMVGIFTGAALCASAVWQGKASAKAIMAYASSGKGFANQLMALGIIETVAIFIMAFAIVLLKAV